MRLPWVSRALYEQARAQIAALEASNTKLIEALTATKEVQAAMAEKDETQPTKPHRRLGLEIRQMATDWAKQNAGTTRGGR